MHLSVLASFDYEIEYSNEYEIEYEGKYKCDYKVPLATWS